MKLKIFISKEIIVFFQDTVYNPSYRLKKENLGFLCKINHAMLNIKKDSMNVLSAFGSTKHSIAYPGINFIVIDENKLIVEDGNGVMFFLKRKNINKIGPAYDENGNEIKK